MTSDQAAARRSLGIVVATIVLAIGLPLIGARTFLGTDVLLRFPPWSETADVDATVTAAPIGDTIDTAYPARTQFFDRLTRGDFAEWNPYPAGGSPLGVVPNSGSLDPLNLPYLFLPDRLALGWVKALEIAVAIAGMVAFLQLFDVRRAAATVAGVVYAFNGFQVVWTNWPQTHVAAWIPALFWAAERLIRGPTAPRIAAMAGVVTAMLFSGFPAVVGYALVALAPYLVVRSLVLTRGRPGLARVRSVSWQAGAVGLALGLGIALAAVQLGPFSEQLEHQDIVDREQTADSHLPSKLLVTAAVPNAYGSPQQGFSYLPVNYIEGQAYIGSAALVLVAAALLRLRTAGRAGPTALFAGLALVTTILVFFGGPLLGLAQDLSSLFGSSFVGRMRSVWAFLLAVLAGFGADTIGRATSTGGRRTAWALGALGAGGALYAALRVMRTADAEGHLRPVATSVIVALVAASIAAAAVLFGDRSRVRRHATVGVCAVVAVEALLFVGPFWPRIDNERFYPVTPSHEFLAANLDDERVALNGLTLYAGTTAHYDLRTLTGHTFHWPTWRELLEAIDPEAMRASSTFSFTSFRDTSRMKSPILDRLGVRYIAIPVAAPQPGAFDDQPPPEGSLELAAGERVEFEVGARPLRAVIVDLAAPGIVDDPSPRLVVEVTGPDGDIVTGARAIRRGLTAGGHQVPVAGEHLPISGRMKVAIWLDASQGSVTLATASTGDPSLDYIVPQDDGLSLAFSDGAAIYENTDGLPRIRFAPNARIETDDAARIELLAGLDDSEVVVLEHADAPLFRDGLGEIVNVRDRVDEIDIEVDVTRSGYLVVADAMQHGWNATVDGRPVELLNADHAVVAVALTPGRQLVRLSFDPDSAPRGLAISIIAGVVLAVALAAPYIRQWRRRRADAAAPPRGVQ